MVLGVTSEKIKIMIVSAIVAIRMPASPNSLTPMIVAMADANMFTKLFPIRIMPKRQSGCSSKCYFS